MVAVTRRDFAKPTRSTCLELGVTKDDYYTLDTTTTAYRLVTNS
jgi:hypothetical protein